MTSVTSTYELALAPPPKPATPTEVALSPHPESGSNAERSANVTMFGENGFDFSDLIDVVNPLQHVPVISTMYRENTGDEIGAVPRVAGATLFFGPIGLASSLFNVFVQQSTGKDVGQHVTDWVLPDDGAEDLAAAPADTSAVGAGVPSDNAVDPVSAWARQEVAWAQSQANTWSRPPQASRTQTTVPDAGPHVRGDDPLAAGPDTVHLTEDARSAAWAYRAAAALADTRLS